MRVLGSCLWVSLFFFLSCSTSSPLQKVERESYRSLEEAGKDLATEVLKHLSKRQDSWIAVTPWVNQEGQPCVLGEKLARKLWKSLKFHLKERIDYIYWSDVSFEHYLFTENYPWDFWIFGKITPSLESFTLEVVLYRVSDKKKQIFSRHLLKLDEQWEKMYRLLLPSPPKGGFSPEQGGETMAQKLEEFLVDEIPSLRRVLVFEAEEAFLREIQKYFVRYLKRGEGRIPKVMVVKKGEKIAPLLYGKEVFLEFSDRPFGKGRRLVQFVVLDRKGFRKTFLCVFTKG